MAISEQSTRVNITMSKDLYEWVEKISKELGISKSALISVAVGQYKAQVVMTDLVSKIPPFELQKLIDGMVKG